jgi:transposase-like protein
VDIENRYGTIIEPERSGKTISDVCIAFGISRETWYKWKSNHMHANYCILM